MDRGVKSEPPGGIADLLPKALRNADLDFIVNGDDNRTPGNLGLSFRSADGEMLFHPSLSLHFSALDAIIKENQEILQ